MALIALVPLLSAQQAPPSTVPHPPTPSLLSIEAEARSSARLPRERVQKVSKEDGRRIGAILTPNYEDIAAYSTFLKQEGTGIQRLFINAGCQSKWVIKVDEGCENFVPNAPQLTVRRRGGGDILATRNELVGYGFFSLSIMTDLGHKDIETATLDEEGIGFLREFRPATTFVGLKEQYSRVTAGIWSGKFEFRDRVRIAEGHLYALRVIAVDAANLRVKRLGRDRTGSIGNPLFGSFASFRYDDRSDVIALIKVVRVEEGNITVVWKRLSRAPSPRIRFGDNEKLADFK